MPTVTEIIETLKKRKNKDEVLAIGIWTAKDIKAVAKDAGVNLSGEDAKDILGILSEEFDPIVGINQDVISDAISEYTDGEVEEDEAEHHMEDLDDFLPDEE